MLPILSGPMIGTIHEPKRPVILAIRFFDRQVIDTGEPTSPRYFDSNAGSVHRRQVNQYSKATR
jgi:hypothetical protein